MHFARKFLHNGPGIYIHISLRKDTIWSRGCMGISSMGEYIYTYMYSVYVYVFVWLNIRIYIMCLCMIMWLYKHYMVYRAIW